MYSLLMFSKENKFNLLIGFSFFFLGDNYCAYFKTLIDTRTHKWEYFKNLLENNKFIVQKILNSMHMRRF